ncbi:cytosine deaminase [Curvularia kusanoi]|uniref:Cytosine deaminase n=1 Tax=Curvularia kusanoi TaxID=90978 RepID=A0A9P4TE55_CURKU|nr:cytosine deaminase [Curvularia kusanoi]
MQDASQLQPTKERPFKRVVIGENKTFMGGEEYLKSKGIEVVVLQNEECEALMQKFIKEKPGDWYEDIGEDQ